MVMSAQLEQARMEQNLTAAPFQHGRLQIVVQNRARLAIPGFKGIT
jgi:hypothetical protein